MDEKLVKRLLDLATEAMTYVPDYFRQKWHLDEELAELKRELFPDLEQTDQPCAGF